MFGRNSINGSVKWLGVPDFLSTYGHPWTSNILAPHPSWRYQVSITNPNWGSWSEGVPDIARPMEWSRPFPSSLPPDDLWKYAQRCAPCPWRSPFKRIICTACKVPPLAATPSVVVWLIDGMTTGMIYGMSRLINNLCGEFLLLVSVSVTFLFFPSLMWVATNGSLFGLLLASFLSEW